MNAYFISGAVLGILCATLYLILCGAKQKTPSLSHGIEIFLSTFGISGGVKICVFVFSGRLAEAFKKSNIGLSDDDVLYFLIGGLALIWIAVDTVVRRLVTTSQAIDTSEEFTEARSPGVVTDTRAPHPMAKQSAIRKIVPSRGTE